MIGTGKDEKTKFYVNKQLGLLLSKDAESTIAVRKEYETQEEITEGVLRAYKEKLISLENKAKNKRS